MRACLRRVSVYTFGMLSQGPASRKRRPSIDRDSHFGILARLLLYSLTAPLALSCSCLRPLPTPAKVKGRPTFACATKCRQVIERMWHRLYPVDTRGLARAFFGILLGGIGKAGTGAFSEPSGRLWAEKVLRIVSLRLLTKSLHGKHLSGKMKCAAGPRSARGREWEEIDLD